MQLLQGKRTPDQGLQVIEKEEKKCPKGHDYSEEKIPRVRNLWQEKPPGRAMLEGCRSSPQF